MGRPGCRNCDWGADCLRYLGQPIGSGIFARTRLVSLAGSMGSGARSFESPSEADLTFHVRVVGNCCAQHGLCHFRSDLLSAVDINVASGRGASRPPRKNARTGTSGFVGWQGDLPAHRALFNHEPRLRRHGVDLVHVSPPGSALVLEPSPNALLPLCDNATQMVKCCRRTDDISGFPGKSAHLPPLGRGSRTRSRRQLSGWLGVETRDSSIRKPCAFGNQESWDLVSQDWRCSTVRHWRR